MGRGKAAGAGTDQHSTCNAQRGTFNVQGGRRRAGRASGAKTERDEGGGISSTHPCPSLEGSEWGEGKRRARGRINVQRETFNAERSTFRGGREFRCGQRTLHRGNGGATTDAHRAPLQRKRCPGRSRTREAGFLAPTPSPSWEGSEWSEKGRRERGREASSQ
jgi:hypothetical protein